MALTWANGTQLKIADIDIETRRIGFHSAGKFSPDGCEPVAIAWSWVGEKKVHCWQLGNAYCGVVNACDPEDMLAYFAAAYDEADIITGHYLKKFDLPVLNGAMLEHGLPLLPPKLVSDTHGDVKKVAGLSKSQENLGLMLELEASKFHMSDHNWRAVARLEPGAMKDCRKRVTEDVRQHKQLRQRLIEAGALRPPRLWSP